VDTKLHLKRHERAALKYAKLLRASWVGGKVCGSVHVRKGVLNRWDLKIRPIPTGEARGCFKVSESCKGGWAKGWTFSQKPRGETFGRPYVLIQDE